MYVYAKIICEMILARNFILTYYIIFVFYMFYLVNFDSEL